MNGGDLMANLQIKGLDDDFYQIIKDLAAAENRSISQQVVHVIREYLSRTKQIRKIKTPAQVLLELSGSWQDTRSAESIMQDIKRSRKNSQKLKEGL